MPNVKSAKKRVKTNKRREAQNRAARSALRTALRKINAAIAEKNVEAIKANLPVVLGLIGRSRRKGLLHENTAARQESRIVKKTNALLSQ